MPWALEDCPQGSLPLLPPAPQESSRAEPQTPELWSLLSSANLGDLLYPACPAFPQLRLSQMISRLDSSAPQNSGILSVMLRWTYCAPSPPPPLHTHPTPSIALLSPWLAPILDIGRGTGPLWGIRTPPLAGVGESFSTGRDAQAPCLPTEPRRLAATTPWGGGGGRVAGSCACPHDSSRGGLAWPAQAPGKLVLQHWSGQQRAWEDASREQWPRGVGREGHNIDSL